MKAIFGNLPFFAFLQSQFDNASQFDTKYNTYVKDVNAIIMQISLYTLPVIINFNRNKIYQNKTKRNKTK